MAQRPVGVEATLIGVVGDDSTGLLAAMLQGVQAKRCMGGGPGAAEDAEHAALLVQLVVVQRRCFGRAVPGSGHVGPAPTACR